MTRGAAAFLDFNLNKDNNIVGVVDPNYDLPLRRISTEIDIFQFFGVEDSVYNHLYTLHEVKCHRVSEI